jgi:hypothetical protein
MWILKNLWYQKLLIIITIKLLYPCIGLKGWKFYSRYNILGWPTNWYGLVYKATWYFFSCKLLPDSKNVHIFYLCRSVLIITGHLRKPIEKILKFIEFFSKLTSKPKNHAQFWNQQAICYQKKVPYLFVGQSKILTLLWKFSIFVSGRAWVEEPKIVRNWCNKHVQLLLQQRFLNFSKNANNSTLL